jgi:hypothetical protein
MKCATCGGEFEVRSQRQRFCSDKCRYKGRRRDERLLYGRKHRRVRASWEPLVAMGTVACARCGQTIAPGERWDLGHADGVPGQYAGPEHAACNRATAGKRRQTLETFVDDPAAGVYWGPPAEVGGPPRRWSRHWFDWRREGGPEGEAWIL